MRIATSSVRSIRKRLPAILQWLAERKPDIVALQKISVSEAAFPTRALEGAGYYSAAFGPTDRTDFGVAVLSRRELPKPEVRFRGLPCPEASGARLLTAGHRTDTVLVHLRSLRKPAQIRQRVGHRTPGGLVAVPAGSRP